MTASDDDLIQKGQDDLIRRGDARRILEEEGFLERSLANLNNLPAVQVAVTPLRYVDPEGETLDQMREHARQHPLARKGDMKLVWVNEGDLYHHSISALTTQPSTDVEALVERLDNLFAMLEEEGYYTKANTADFARKAITTIRTQLAEAWERLDYWCERSVEWDAEMLQKDREVLEAIARAERAEAALAAQIEADAGIAGAKGWPRRMSLERYAELSVDDEARMDAADAIAAAIRSQPHDRTALDRMLAEHEVRLREAREKALREAYQAVGRIVAGYELREDFRAEEVAGKCHDAILALIEEDKEN